MALLRFRISRLSALIPFFITRLFSLFMASLGFTRCSRVLLTGPLDRQAIKKNKMLTKNTLFNLFLFDTLICIKFSLLKPLF